MIEFYFFLIMFIWFFWLLWWYFERNSQKGRKVNVETRSQIYEVEAQLIEKIEIKEETYLRNIADYQLTFKILNDALAQPQLIDNAIHDTFRAGEVVRFAVNKLYYTRLAEKGVGLLKFRRITFGGLYDFELMGFEILADYEIMAEIESGKENYPSEKDYGQIYAVKVKLYRKVIEEWYGRHQRHVIEHYVTYELLSNTPEHSPYKNKTIRDLPQSGDKLKLKVNASVYADSKEGEIGLLKFKQVYIGAQYAFRFVSFAADNSLTKEQQ